MLKPLDYLAIATSIFFLGTNFVAVKYGVSQFPPVFMVALRFTIVAAVLIWIAGPPGEKIKHIIGLSVTMGLIHFTLFFAGISGVDAAVAAIVFQLGVPFSVLLAWLLIGDRFGWRRSIGMVVAFAGVVILVGGPKSPSSLWHVFLVFASAAAWGLGAVQIKKMGPINVFKLGAWMAVFAVPQLYLATFLLESGQFEAVQNADWKGWVSVFYAAIGSSIIGYGLWYYLIRKYPVSRVLPFSLITPVVGVISAVLMLGETLDAHKILGGAITLAGVAFIQLRQSKTNKTGDVGA